MFRLTIGHSGAVHSLDHLLVRRLEQDGNGVQDLRPGVLIELEKGRVSPVLRPFETGQIQPTGKAVSRESPE